MFKQFYLGCLSHASYFIASDGEAAVVDPQRDVQQYLDEAAREGVRIKYVIETHLHADFVSGHCELAQRTGAEIVIGAAANAAFAHRAVRDGEELRVGHYLLRALETPGHTPEGVSWLVMGEAGEPRRVLTGDTLFIGDVGRPDLAGGRGFTAEDMAGMLYDSLHGKLLTLEDDVEVWPAHGAGSACGRNISRERSSTIGVQRALNYALRPMPREEFVKMMTSDLAAPPRYFAMDAELNRRGARPLAEVSAAPLAAQQVRDWVARGAIVLDVRDSGEFGRGHIRGSLNIGLGGQYASWAGTVIPADRPVVLVAAPDRLAEAVMRLARVGLETVVGYLDGGVEAWPEPLEMLHQLDPAALDARRDSLQVLDVRGPGEYAGGHVPNARNLPLPDLPARVRELDPAAPVAIICASGYRSSLAASILAQHQFAEVYNVAGGTNAWVAGGFPTA
jgi:glyoxylase-like metal-dependent hydrolase (beta-lactamase superfamily II)